MKKQKYTIQFTEMLLSLLKGNTNLIDSLHILSSPGIEPRIQQESEKLLVMMKKGRSFSGSLAMIPKGNIHFIPLYLTLIKASEMTGTIDKVLEDILIDMKRKQKTLETIVTVMLYPAIIILVACIGTIFIIAKGIPLFVQSGMLVETSLNSAVMGIIIAGIFLFLSAGLMFFILYSIFVKDSPEFRIFYLLSFLLSNNIPITEALSQCIASLGESKQGKTLVLIKKDIIAGVHFPDAFAKNGKYSSYITGWLTIADNDGDIAGAFKNISDFFQKKDVRIREFASKCIEPVFIIITGIYLLILLQTVIMPILTRAGGIL